MPAPDPAASMGTDDDPVHYGCFAAFRVAIKWLAAFVFFAGLESGSGFSLNGYKWPADTQVAMRLDLTRAPVALEDGSSSWNASAADALAIWNQYLDTVKFVQAPPVIPSARDAANSIFFSNTIYGETFPNGVLAVTLNYSVTGSGVFTETDVIFNDALKWNSYRGAIHGPTSNPIYDFHRVALHEFGHVLGLAHPDTAGQGVYALMNSFVSDFDHLLEEDILGGKSLYGVRFTSPLPLPSLNVGNAMSYQLAANNRPTSYAATGLPPGLKLNATTGLIDGAPTTSGTYAAFIAAHGLSGDLSATIGFVVWPAGQQIGVPVATFPVQALTLVDDPQRKRIYARTRDEIVVIDPSMLSIVKTVPLSGTLDISLSADGSRLWIAANSRIASIDLDTFAFYPDVPASGPRQVREGANHQLYFTTFSYGFSQVDSVTGVTSGPHLPPNRYVDFSIEVTPDRRTLIAATRQGGLLARYNVEGATPLLQETAEQGGSFRQFCLSPDGSRIWYETRTQDSVGIPYSRFYRTADLSRPPVRNNILGTGPLTFSPDNSLAYGENDFLTPQPAQQSKSELHVSDPASGAVLGKMDLPFPSETILVDSGNHYVFVAASESVGIPNPLRVYSVFPALAGPSAPRPKRLDNVSTRAFVQNSENVEIGGFIIQGDRSKKVALRAIGPSLEKFGLPALIDPVLELHDSSRLIATNDNWIGNDQQVLATELVPGDNREATIVTTLAPGAYTAVVRGADGRVGTAVFEVYDLDTGNSKVANLSTRSWVGINDQAMIGGFVVAGDQGTPLLVRALGPSLINYGVSDALSDPFLEVHDKDGGLLAQDDDWRTYQEQQLIDHGFAPKDDRESAMILSLNPGSYTAVVRGKNNGTGVGLVEIYNLDAN